MVALAAPARVPPGALRANAARVLERRALAAPSRATRPGPRVARARRASPSASSSSTVEVVTFDLDDTLWPTTPVVGAANQAFVDFCQERIPGFPDCAGVNEYMKVRPENPTPSRSSASSSSDEDLANRLRHLRVPFSDIHFPRSFPLPLDNSPQAIRKEREEASAAVGERHSPLSFASLRIAGGFRAATALGFPEADAVAVVSRGYHIAWIPTRGAAAEANLFPGVREALAKIRANHPRAVIGSITNGLGSAAGAGLGDFFDFEISADALMDEAMVHGDDARKPARYPFELAMRLARETMRTNEGGETVPGWSGDPSRWVHVGDDLLNDCKAAKSHAFRTVLVEEPGVVPYQPGGGGGSYPGDPARGTEELDAAALVDARVASVSQLPDVLSGWW